MDNYLKPYGDIELQRRMVSDLPRSDAFATSIREVVKPGDIVLDVGTGTGILAMFAAKAGAKKVYAVDATEIAFVAKELVEANGLTDQVEVIHGRSDELQLEHKVDLIISEWLGNGAFAEGMLHAVLDARDDYLAPGGKMLPAKVRMLIAPLDEPLMYYNEGPGFWREPLHGLDFSKLQPIELQQGRPTQIQIDPAAFLAPEQVFLELDLLTASIDDVWFEGELEFTPNRNGILNGFCVWFEADLSPTVKLDTSPRSVETHWAQSYMAFTPREVAAGQPVTVRVDFSYNPDPMNICRHVDLCLGIDDDEIEFVID